MEFEGKIRVVDRRKEKAEAEAATILTIEEAVPQEEQPSTYGKKWKSIGLMIVFIQGQGNAPIPAGRAIGMRDDGKGPFIADLIFPPIWPEKLDWVKEVRKRLDTFLGCECKEHNPCAVHKIIMPQWTREDTKRISEISSQPIPECIEILMKADQARQNSKIIVPR